MWVTKDTVEDDKFDYGQTTVGAAAVQVITVARRDKYVKGILLRAVGDNDPVPNTAPIWVGDANVTANSGMAIAPGETMSLPLESGEKLYAISNTANQVLAWWAM